jgi:phosphate/sulfate permease
MQDWQRDVMTARGRLYRRMAFPNIVCFMLGMMFGGLYMTGHCRGTLMQPDITKALTVLLWTSVAVVIGHPLWVAWRTYPLKPPKKDPSGS